MSEWLLEDLAAPDTLRRGMIDRLVFDGQSWWILDYKTSRPEAGGDWEEFIAQEDREVPPPTPGLPGDGGQGPGAGAGGDQAGPLFHRLPRAVPVP